MINRKIEKAFPHDLFSSRGQQQFAHFMDIRDFFKEMLNLEEVWSIHTAMFSFRLLDTKGE